jgi:hypothetical protein
MKLPIKIVLYILAFISVAAGLAKVLQTQQEIDFFAQAGLGVGPMIALGIVQIAGGAMAVVAKFRHLGLLAVIAGFAISVLVIALTGDVTFALVSLLPVVLGIGLFLYDRKLKTVPL